MASTYSEPFRLLYVRPPGSRRPLRFASKKKARAAAERVAKEHGVPVESVLSESPSYFVYEPVRLVR